MTNRGYSEAAFPVDDGEQRDAELFASFFLGKAKLQTFFLDVLAQSLGLKIGFLWFQCLKGYGCDLQKSNETLRERQFEKLKAQRGFVGRAAN